MDVHSEMHLRNTSVLIGITSMWGVWMCERAAHLAPVMMKSSILNLALLKTYNYWLMPNDTI